MMKVSDISPVSISAPVRQREPCLLVPGQRMELVAEGKQPGALCGDRGAFALEHGGQGRAHEVMALGEQHPFAVESVGSHDFSLPLGSAAAQGLHDVHAHAG